MTEITIYNVQRSVTPKLGKQKLWFLFSTCSLMVLFICATFHKNIPKGFQVTEQTQVFDGDHCFQCLMGDNQSYGSCALHIISWCIIFLSKVIKISLNSFQVTERTQFCDTRMDRLKKK